MSRRTGFPLGDPGVDACMRLTQAFRSLPRPSSERKPSYPPSGWCRPDLFDQLDPMIVSFFTVSLRQFALHATATYILQYMLYSYQLAVKSNHQPLLFNPMQQAVDLHRIRSPKNPLKLASKVSAIFMLNQKLGQSSSLNKRTNAALG